MEKSCRQVFQFHIGAIRSDGLGKVRLVPMNNFNSILVQLEVPEEVIKKCIGIHFNSILVQLEVCLSILVLVPEF